MYFLKKCGKKIVKPLSVNVVHNFQYSTENTTADYVGTYSVARAQQADLLFHPSYKLPYKLQTFVSATRALLNAPAQKDPKILLESSPAFLYRYPK
jgi:hypothetical protein